MPAPYETPQFPTGVVVTLEGNRLMIDPASAGKIPTDSQSENSFSMEGTSLSSLRMRRVLVTGVIQHWTEGDRFAVRRK